MRRILTSWAARAFKCVMAEDALPPFELFYREFRDDVYSFLVRAVGEVDAEDVFQETFLRALRAYPDVQHTRNLRAWVFTIASRLAIDGYRRRRPPPETSTPVTEDRLPAYRELEPYVKGLPHTEQAAVVLRYGYDLDYEDIGAMLGSSASAARQAASAGVRRLRKETHE